MTASYVDMLCSCSGRLRGARPLCCSRQQPAKDHPHNHTRSQLTVAAAAALLALALWYRAYGRVRPVYLLDFAVALPPEEWKFPKQKFLKSSSCNPVSCARQSDCADHCVCVGGGGEGGGGLASAACQRALQLHRPTAKPLPQL